MNSIKSASRGLIALLLVSAVLLVSDLQNRNGRPVGQQPVFQGKAQSGVKIRFKLGMVHYIDSPNSEACDLGIRKALQDENLREGVDFTLKVYNAQGDISTLNSIAGMIANEPWDLVFAVSTPSVQMLAKKTPKTKIAFTNVGDPVAAGLGKSFSDHNANICGISTMSDFDGLLKLVQTLHPGIKKVGTVFTPSEINSVSYKDHLEESAKNRGIRLIAVPASSATEVLDAANSLVSQRIEAFCQISDNLTCSCSSAILKVSLNNKVPYYGFISGQMEQGAVAVCARDYFLAGYEAGQMGLEVLSGKHPAQIPYRCVAKTDYLINPEAARHQKIPISGQLYQTFPQLKIYTPKSKKLT